MPKVREPADLLEYKLGVLLATEKAIAKSLPRMKKEANDAELARGLERHLEETKQHVANLEEAFRRLGRRPRRAKAPAMEGLELAHKGFAAEASDDVLPDVLDSVAVSSAAAVEHHEIAGYESLITLAEGVGAREVAELANRNLEQDRRMLEETKKIAARFAKAKPEMQEALARGVRRRAPATRSAVR